MKLFAVALLWAAGACPAWAQPPVPLLWKVSDADNSLYLLGSFHLLKESDYPLAPAVDAAFSDSRRLYFEVSADEMNDPALARKLMQSAARTDGTSLQSSVAPATWSRLERYTVGNGMNAAELQGLKAWFVGMLLTLVESQKLGLNPALGMDKQLMDRALRAGKQGGGLETADAQIKTLDSADAALQEQFLKEALHDMDNFPADMEAMHAAWRRGDDAKLYELAAADMRKDFPALYQRLLLDRNQSWIGQLDALLRDHAGENYLVVVGALHLLGEDGVVRMLANRGYRVERLR